MNLDVKDEAIDILNVKGRIKNKKLSMEKLPDIILTEQPIEIQFVSFSGDGYGHRSSFGHHWQLEFDFHVDTAASSVLSKPHRHDYWEIIVADAGALEMQIESSLYHLNRGDICILNRATRHAEHFQPGQSIIYVVLSMEYIASWPKDANISFGKPISQLFENGMNLPYYQNKDYIIARPAKEEAYSFVSDSIQAMKEEFLRNMPGSRYLMRGLVYRLISTVTASKAYTVDYFDMRAEDKFGLADSAKRIIDKNKRRTTLFELERALQYSGPYINQLFKEKYHCSVAEYNQSVCLQHMANQLLTTSKTVEEICHKLGYTNRTHLYKLFREKYGCSPMEFRKNR